PGRWGCRSGASAARQAQRAAQAAGVAGAGTGEVRGQGLRGFWPDADGGAALEGKAGGGSRDLAAVAAGGREADGASPQAGASAMAGTQTVLWSDGATG